MEEKEKTRFSLTNFKKSTEGMIATNDAIYSDYWGSRRYGERRKNYTPEEIDQILSSSNIKAKQELSKNYFNSDGFYQRIILHYATLLMYAGVLIPQVNNGKDMSQKKFQQAYFDASNFIENNDMQSFFVNWAIKCFRDGGYYGLIQTSDKEILSLIDLPPEYCSSNYKDIRGNDVIQFDLTYFNRIIDDELRERTLRVFPKYVRIAYEKYRKGKGKQYILLPSDTTVCFPLFDGQPFFLNIIPSIMNYNKTVDVEQERALDEIRKIIVQRIPHLTDGTLLFEPDEAEVIHQGTVGMLKKNSNISVLTSYADVDAIVSKSSNDAASSILENMASNIYRQAGTSSQLFGATTNATLETSIKNDLSLVMVLAYKFSKAITNIVNANFSKSGIKFRYKLLPLTYYNSKEFIEETFKLASFGYSFILPILGLGISQNNLSGLKDLENNCLKLHEKLIPLSSAYTQSKEDSNSGGETNPSGSNITTDPLAGESGAPTKTQESKQESTIKKEESQQKEGTNG